MAWVRSFRSATSAWWTRAPRSVVLGLVAAVACAGTALALLVVLGDDPGSGPAAAAPQAPPASTPAQLRSEPATVVEAAEEPPPASTPSRLPTSSDGPRLHVPAIGIDAPIVPVPLKPGGVLDPPTAVTDVGWWDGSAEAGADNGQTVMTGHTVQSGGGVMDDLDQLTEGERVRVTDSDGFVDYEVTEVVIWSKQELYDNAVETFGQDRYHGRLVLVTCEDWLAPGTFASNVVVFADPVTRPDPEPM